MKPPVRTEQKRLAWRHLDALPVEMKHRLASCGQHQQVIPVQALAIGIDVDVRPISVPELDQRQASAPAGSRHAKSTLDGGRTFGRVTAGMHWFGGEQFDIRLQYDGLFSSQVRSHGGMLKASWRY